MHILFPKAFWGPEHEDHEALGFSGFNSGVSFGDFWSFPSSETQGQIVGTRESLNGRKIYMERTKVKNGEKSPWGQCQTQVFWHQSEARTAATVWN